ncbi:MAG TPA: hypothetical protein VGK73_04930 [Polyangiaceae bacterium]
MKSVGLPLKARAAGLALLLSACDGQTLDAGSDVSNGLLPIDQRNPIILSNDGTGNWYGLYAILFSNAGGPDLAGITINASSYATDLSLNVAAWQELVDAARASGLDAIPDPVASTGAPLVRPADGDIEATVPNASEGARLIVDVSSRTSAPDRPVAVVTGGRLTDVADAYLLDPGVSERIVVVAALGSSTASRAVMSAPNGELDPWADWIVAQRLRYVQVSAFYDPTIDLPAAELARLPQNPLVDLVVAEQPNIADVPSRADQVSVLAAALPEFVTAVERVAPDPDAVFDASAGPTLVPGGAARHWLVTRIDPAVAGTRLRRMLADPKTYGE